MELAKHGRRKKKWYEDDSDSSSDSSSNTQLSEQQNTADASESMECDTLSVKSVNEACVVPYQENKFNRTKKPLEATCELLTGIVGLLKASQTGVI